MQEKVDEAAFRTSLPRMNELRANKDNRKLSKIVMGEVKPRLDGGSPRGVTQGKQYSTIVGGFKEYCENVVDYESSEK